MAQKNKTLFNIYCVFISSRFPIIDCCLFVVHEGQGAIVTRLGAIKQQAQVDRSYTPGLYFGIFTL